MARPSLPLLKFIATWSLAVCRLTALDDDVWQDGCKFEPNATGPTRCDKPVSLLQLSVSGLARSFTSMHEILHDPEKEQMPEKDNATSSVKAIEDKMEDSLNKKTQKDVSDIRNHMSEPRRHKDVESNQSNATKTADEQVQGAKTEPVDAKVDQNGSLTNVTVESTAFANAKYQTNSTQDVVVQVEIAEPNDIVSVYVVMFVPLLMGWFYYWHRPSDRLYSILLQLSVTSLTVGNVLVNQSLCVLMKAPMALTTVHAASMLAASTVVACVQRFFEGSAAEPMRRRVTCLYWWLPASVLFAAYQVTDHLMSYLCSISERTVLGNLSPVLSLVLELNLGLCLVDWPSRQTNVSLSSKMSLLAMVFGAIIFALQYPDFTAAGVYTAIGQNVCQIVYRLTQRYVLGSMTGVSTAELVAFDGLVLLVPSFLFSTVESQGFWTSWTVWLNNPSVVAMFILSGICYGFGHYVAILMLRTSTATAIVVLTNVANALCVIMGIYFFGDKDFERPMAFLGIVVSIIGGCYYGMNGDVHGDSHHEVHEDPKKSDCTDGQPRSDEDA